jgi:hypothetical protein
MLSEKEDQKMRNARPLVPCFVVVALALAGSPRVIRAACDNQPDAPGCPCFVNTATWDPSGAFIQDVAHQTVGTQESCNCPGTSSCTWSFDDGGKPYYQMIVGCNSELCAEFVSMVLANFGWYYDDHQEWCSETVSYWHRETGLPYDGGYRTAWHRNWQNYCIEDMRLWYMTEDPVYGHGGRGRWIDAEYELSYEDFELGVTVPVPGSYVAISAYDVTWDAWYVGDYAHSHSLIIDEMWVHRTSSGEVFQVEVSLLQGNATPTIGAPAQVTTGHWDDLLEASPQGPDSVTLGSRRKIYGFGVDLDASGNPVYDPSRLHYVDHLTALATFTARPGHASDPLWDAYASRFAAVVPYAALMAQTGGPDVACSTGNVKVSGIPDGAGGAWYFPAGLEEEVVIDIDLRDVNPVPIRGVELVWGDGLVPPFYQVEHAGGDGVYHVGSTPDMSNNPPPFAALRSPVPSLFTAKDEGTDVRYVRITFPAGIFTEDATLEELRFMYQHGPWQDDPNPAPVDVVRQAVPGIPTLSTAGLAGLLLLVTAAALRLLWHRVG